MKMFKKIPVFILLFTGYLCNAQDYETESIEPETESREPTVEFSPPKEHGVHIKNSSPTSEMETYWRGPVPGRSLPTLVVAGVSIALVLLCILIVAIFWYAWRKSQEGSIELNPIPYGEAGVSLQNVLGPENQQEWPFERAVQ